MNAMIVKTTNSKGLFEITIASILFAPIVFFLASYLLGQSFGILLSTLIPLLLIVTLYRSSKIKTFKELLSKIEIETFGFLGLTFALFLWACLTWPDFIAMGERLRDYALLASVSDSPIEAKEPWMVGENLNYYLYWYRFAAYWSTIFGISVWNTYHLLAAFSFALFTTTLFRLMRCYLNISLTASAITALLISVGSNLSGVLSAFSGSSDWWGPSRVIKGAINEFPAWSFLLGDLHPHFLNLVLTPLLLCFAFAIANFSLNWGSRLALILLLFLVAGPLQYNCNAWEVPMAGITFIIALSLAAFAFRSKLISIIKEFPKLLIKEIKETKLLVLTTALVLCLVSLIISCRNIQPADYPWRWVKDPIPASTLQEIIMHWGIPLAALLIGLILKLKVESITSISCSIIFALAIATQNSLLVLVSLTAWLIAEALRDLKSSGDSKQSLGPVLLYTLGISSLILIILGELVFLDDPYGGENERMNTIFKIYSATWSPLHLFAFCFLIKELISRNLTSFIAPSALLVTAAMPAFFIHTIEYRKNGNPSMEGLASIEQQFPGSTDAIRYLRKQPRQTVLEAQGNPYSYTTHVATLGGQDSYLGWANHVGLLTGKHEEVSRREKISEQIYSESNCERKKELAKAEKINLIVVGALEKQKYGQDEASAFSCFESVFNNEEYLIVKVQN